MMRAIRMIPLVAFAAAAAPSLAFGQAASSGAAQDTIRYTVIVDGHTKGERRMWQEGPAAWRYEYEGDPYDSYHFPRSERLVLDADGLPIQMEIRGESGRGTWEERFELRESRARWSTLTRWSLRPFDPPDLFGGDPFEEVGKQSADTLVVGPAYYSAVYPVHDVGIAARALLRRPDQSLPLLPAGEARLEVLEERDVEVAGRTGRIHHYAVHGLDLRPVYVWLDEDGATFADEWSIRAGWEVVFPELRVATEQALADHHARLVEGLVPPVRDRPLVIRGARLFDPVSKTTRPDITILVEGNRIVAVGADGSMDLPPEAEIIDATGRTALPGLWDMHAHHGIPSLYLELDAPLHLAAGITTARDLGSHTGPILSLQSRIESGEALGPRLLLSGFIDGPGRRPSGVLVGSVAEARAAVDRFAELGYIQIKIYGQVPAAFVPAIIERARAHGMRVSGHVPAGMNLREAVEAGFDEIQHADEVFMNLGGVPDFLVDLEASYEAIEKLTADPVRVRELVELMVTHEVALDPTLTILDSWSRVPLPWFVRMLERLPPQARRRLAAAQGFKLWPVHPLWNQIFDNVLDIVREMHEAGVPVLPGSDMMPGIAVQRELELYVQAGIPAPEVLTLATLGAARVMGMDDELGSIEPGKLADLILVDGDPTADISDIRRVVTVVKDGRVYDPAAIYRAVGVEPCCGSAEPGTAKQRSLAVLPFADLSPAKDQEYFSDGFSEELWEIFGHLPELRVAYRTSAFAFKGKDVGLDSIGRALNVRHILKGSVRKAGDRVHITAQLIDASTGHELWSERYDRELKDLFQVENAIAREVANQLQLELGGGRAGAVPAREETKDPEAHLLLLRGRSLLRQFTREGVEQAEPLLKQAIARDPAYARAHAELAAVYRNQAEQGVGPVEMRMGQARAALERALELEPGLARAHYQEGWIAYGSGDWQVAEASLARAVELNPGYAPAHAFRAILLAVLGRTEEAMTAADRAAALDPLSVARKTDVTAAYIYARHYERAVDAARSVLVLEPDRPSTWGDLAFVYALMGRYAEAIAAGERARELAPQEHWPLTALGYAYARAGRNAEARRILHSLENLPDADPYLRAILYAGVGDKDEVFPLLERAVAEKNSLLAGLGVDPVFDPYRSDPRMRRLLERLNLPAEPR